MSTPAPPAARPGPSHVDGALPTFIVIGGMKCGTTSLYRYLSLHPEIGMSAHKELAYFAREWNWTRGEAWYRGHFDPEDRIRGEASPQYTCFPKYRDVPERMHALVPDARLIYLVRDPVERLVAHYCHSAASGREDRPLDEAVRDPTRTYLHQSRYYSQIERYLPYYDRDALLVVDQEALRDRRRETLREVFSFLGVAPDVWDVRFQFEWHRTARKRRRTPLGERIAASWPMQQVTRLPSRYRWVIQDAVYRPFSQPVGVPTVTSDLRAYIAEQIAEDLARWRDFTGRPFSHWSL